MIKQVILLMLLGLLVGCGSIAKKNKNLEAISQTTANIAYQQNKALNNTNIILAKQYNQQIQVINSDVTDKKTTNFNSIVSSVLNNKYQIDKSIELELEKTNAELNEYKKYWGLNGVKLSLIHFSRNLLYTSIGITILFVLLRIFSASSPIITAIWNVIANILGWGINQLALVCPKLLDKIKNTEEEIVDGWKKIFIKPDKK